MESIMTIVSGITVSWGLELCYATLSVSKGVVQTSANFA